MENSIKIFILSFAILTLSVLTGIEFRAVRKGANIVKEKSYQLEESTTLVSESMFSNVDNKKITGSEVINFINLYGGDVPLIVATEINKGFCDFEAVRDINSNTYISSTSTFTGKVNKTKNGNARYVTFIEKNAELTSDVSTLVNTQTELSKENKKLDLVSCDVYYLQKKYWGEQKTILEIKESEENLKNEILSACANPEVEGDINSARNRRTEVINNQIQQYTSLIQKEHQTLNELQVALSKGDVSILDTLGGE